ncbi:MAG: dicarboxylate/amino acid:cation symporter, partial [Alphaproteobacteria bacterium]|nr:dicarboxylate/amino acid:cation symporter [Alphaproteobacteria bacterium]
MKLWHKVLIGLILGIAFGYLTGQTPLLAGLGWNGKDVLTNYVKPIGTVFIHLIKMVVVPLIFFSLIYGITNMTDAEAFRRVGLKSVGAYLMTGAFAVVIGLSFGTVFHP